MALFCSPCNFSLFSHQSHKKFSISRPFAPKRLFIISPNPFVSKSFIFFNFSPSLQIPHCCTCSSSSSSSSSSSRLEPNKEIAPTSIIFVKGLAKSTSQGSLKTAFSQFGDVSRVKIITDKKTGESLGFAYVWFSNEEFVFGISFYIFGCLELETRKVFFTGNSFAVKFFEGRFISVTTARHGSCKTRVKPKPYKF